MEISEILKESRNCWQSLLEVKGMFRWREVVYGKMGATFQDFWSLHFILPHRTASAGLLVTSS